MRTIPMLSERSYSLFYDQKYRNIFIFELAIFSHAIKSNRSIPVIHSSVVFC